jgi:hypothetical protein
VRVGVRSVLPVDGVHLLLGNDLAGDKVVVNSIVTDIPVLEEVYDPIIEDVLDLNEHFDLRVKYNHQKEKVHIPPKQYLTDNVCQQKNPQITLKYWVDVAIL